MDEEEFLVDDPGTTGFPNCDRNEQALAAKRKRSETPNSKQGSKSSKGKKSAVPAPKVFQEKWLLEPAFKGWLVKVQGDKFKAKCKSCDATFQAGKSEVEKHAKSQKHVKTVAQIQGQQTLHAFSPERNKHADTVKSAEIRMAAYFAEHNIAFNCADHLLAVQKQCFADSKVAKDMSLGRDKCNAIVRNVIAKTETEELVEDLKNNLFAILIDESTNLGNEKSMCVMVQYLNPRTSLPRVTLLEMVRMDSRDCSGAAMWNAFTACLAKHNIPVTNVVGLACDSAAVMIGQNNSFWSRLKTACPWAILLPCICHSAATVASNACAALPAYVEQHLRAVTNYMNGSPKRCAELQEFQEFYGEQQERMLKLSTTRWLVLLLCIDRYLKHRQSFLAFFELRSFEDKDNKDREVAKILHDLKNPFTKAYMEFLSFALNFTNEFNAMFQAKSVMIHKLASSSLKLLENLCQNFIRPEHLSKVFVINFSLQNHFVPIDEVYLGPCCSKTLDELPADPALPPDQGARQLMQNRRSFRQKCLDFYIKAATEIRKRLPLQNDVVSEMVFLDPKVLLSQSARSGPNGICELKHLFAAFGEKLSLDPNALALEWRKIPRELAGAQRDSLLESSVEDTWLEIRRMKNFHDQMVFPELTKLASLVMILPHSNAESERQFSIVTDVRTKKRNRMGAACLNAICVARTSFRSKNLDCTSFIVSKEHLKKHNQTMYDK